MTEMGICSKQFSKGNRVLSYEWRTFDYRDNYLGDIAEQVEQDIQFNDVEYDISKSADEPYGFQHQPETIGYIKLMVKDLHRLKDLLHANDYADSGDSSEDDFLALARRIFCSEHPKENDLPGSK